MSEIKRRIAIRMKQNGEDIESVETVDYTDHLAALQQARIDAVREFTDFLLNRKGDLLHPSMISKNVIEYYGENYIEQLKEQGE